MMCHEIGSVAELGQDLKKTVEMGEAGTEAIDEFPQGVFAVQEIFIAVFDFGRNRGKHVRLNFSELIGRESAKIRKIRVCLFPRRQFVHPLTVHL